MVAVAVATPLHQEEAQQESGRWCEGRGSAVPSSLVWVSVPASGSASSSAPGSLNGLSLREEEEEEEGVRKQNVHSDRNKDEAAPPGDADRHGSARISSHPDLTALKPVAHSSHG